MFGIVGVVLVWFGGVCWVGDLMGAVVHEAGGKHVSFLFFLLLPPLWYWGPTWEDGDSGVDSLGGAARKIRIARTTLSVLDCQTPYNL